MKVGWECFNLTFLGRYCCLFMTTLGRLDNVPLRMSCNYVRFVQLPTPLMLFLMLQRQAAFRKKGIRVNCVCPGSTDTDIYKTVGNLELTKEQQELLVSTHKQKWALYFYINQRLQLWTSSHKPILVISFRRGYLQQFLQLTGYWYLC